MSRLIFLVVVIGIVYWLLKSYMRKNNQVETPKSSEDMVRCIQCGVHLPKSESIFSGGEYFCCDAHRQERTKSRG